MVWQQQRQEQIKALLFILNRHGLSLPWYGARADANLYQAFTTDCFWETENSYSLNFTNQKLKSKDAFSMIYLCLKYLTHTPAIEWDHMHKESFVHDPMHKGFYHTWDKSCNMTKLAVCMEKIGHKNCIKIQSITSSNKGYSDYRCTFVCLEKNL